MLKDFIEKHPELRFEQAYLEGQILEAKEAEKIAEMPSRDELIAKLLNLLQSPIRRLAVALNSPLQQFANVVAQIADKGDDEPAETQEAEASADAEEAADETEAAPEAEAASESEEASETQAPAEPEEEAAAEAEPDPEAEAGPEDAQETQES